VAPEQREALALEVMRVRGESNHPFEGKIPAADAVSPMDEFDTTT